MRWQIGAGRRRRRRARCSPACVGTARVMFLSDARPRRGRARGGRGGRRGRRWWSRSPSAAAVARWSRRCARTARRFGARAGAFVAARARPGRAAGSSADELARDQRAGWRSPGLREERLEDSRRELVSWVSHDLRTPLAGHAGDDRGARGRAGRGPGALPPADPRRGRPDGPDGRRPLRALPHPRRRAAASSPEPVVLGDLVSEAIAGADPVARARGVRLGGRGRGGARGHRRPGRAVPGDRPTWS